MISEYDKKLDEKWFIILKRQMLYWKWLVIRVINKKLKIYTEV